VKRTHAQPGELQTAQRLPLRNGNYKDLEEPRAHPVHWNRKRSPTHSPNQLPAKNNQEHNHPMIIDLTSSLDWSAQSKQKHIQQLTKKRSRKDLSPDPNGQRHSDQVSLPGSFSASNSESLNEADHGQNISKFTNNQVPPLKTIKVMDPSTPTSVHPLISEALNQKDIGNTVPASQGPLPRRQKRKAATPRQTTPLAAPLAFPATALEPNPVQYPLQRPNHTHYPAAVPTTAAACAPWLHAQTQGPGTGIGPNMLRQEGDWQQFQGQTAYPPHHHIQPGQASFSGSKEDIANDGAGKPTTQNYFWGWP